MVAPLVIVLCFGFTPVSNAVFLGTYASYTKANTIELIVNQDNTFSYTEKLCTGKNLKCNGVWKAKRNSIILESSNKTLNFHKKWKFDKAGTKANSRNGMLFYTLRKVQ